MELPANLMRLVHEPAGAAWIERLPGLLADLARDWELDLGAPFQGSNVSYVCPAHRRGDPVVLKVQWPHEESTHEVAALRLWDGDGAIRLLAHDSDRHALLLERCSPGIRLAAGDVKDPLSILIDLLPRLWMPAGTPFRTLAQEAAGWRSHLVAKREAAGRQLGRDLVDAAMGYLEDLPDSQGPQVLVHQDLHGDNVLARSGSPGL